jgi:hypothetical protein
MSLIVGRLDRKEYDDVIILYNSINDDCKVIYDLLDIIEYLGKDRLLTDYFTTDDIHLLIEDFDLPYNLKGEN